MMVSHEEPSFGALLRERHVLQLVPVSKATFRRWLRSGEFPAGVRLPGRIVVWRRDVVQEWIRAYFPSA